MDNESLGRLLRSKSRPAQFLALATTCLFFLPAVFRVMGDESLNVWQRLEQVSLAAGQTVGAIALAAIPPESLEDKDQG